MRWNEIVLCLSLLCSITTVTGTLPVGDAKPGANFDAAPFGYLISSSDNKSYGVQWAEPRKIRRVIVEFPPEVTPPKPERVRLEFWRGVWNGQPDPVRDEQGAAAVGWAGMDDWTNGAWRDSAAQITADDHQLVITFRPADTIFKEIKSPGVTYRKTLKLRLVSEDPLPKVLRFQALTDAVWKPLTVRISWGSPADSSVQLSPTEITGHMEAFNGVIGAVRPLPGTVTKVDDQLHWTSPPAAAGGVEAEIMTAIDPLDPAYDRTVVTARLSDRPFSFAADEVAQGARVLVNDLGTFVTRGDDAITIDAYRQQLREFPGRTVYDRVFDQPEQSLSRAWNEMPLKFPLYFVHGLPGDRNAFRQDPNGGIALSDRGRWFSHIKSPRDSARKDWPNGMLSLGFGFPGDQKRGGRELKDGYLPLLRTWWQDGPLYYELQSIPDTLDGKLDRIAWDEPTVLLMRLRVHNTSNRESGTAHLRLDTSVKGERLILAKHRQWKSLSAEGVSDLGTKLRYLVRLGRGGQTVAKDNATNWSLLLKPGQEHTIEFLIPSITLTGAEEIRALDARDFDKAVARLIAFWTRETERGAEILTPEPWLNEFYKAHARHLLVNCWGEKDSNRLHAHVGTFNYGVFPDESGMMIRDLDMRGYHNEAERCLESFLHYQGTVPMPGNFTDKKGLFYGSGGHDTGGYNKSHGWVLWIMANHWWMTHDRKWMEHAASKLVDGCDWVIRQRATTMRQDADGQRPIEYGFLPSGSLEDVTDYWYWMVTNACTVWGFQAVADALTDYGHPEAARLQREARAYNDDFMRGMEESRIRAPVVRLRDRTYVPRYPSQLHERGRSHGWLRETLEGSIHLLITELIPSQMPSAKWILKDFEDNLYISNLYGYAIPTFDSFWFSRGGFSMQANLLGGPLPYLYRDEPKHYLRCYFNSLASAFYPETKMCNEHSYPELGHPRGDHFKSSDEAQSTYWLRLMFVREAGDDLYLGQVLPRAWLADGRTIGIRRGATNFGPISYTITSKISQGTIHVSLDPPHRNPPRTIYLRLRHPEARPIQSVEVNGRSHTQFDPGKEWIVLPGNLTGLVEIVARYK